MITQNQQKVHRPTLFTSHIEIITYNNTKTANSGKNYKNGKKWSTLGSVRPKKIKIVSTQWGLMPLKGDPQDNSSLGIMWSKR